MSDPPRFSGLLVSRPWLARDLIPRARGVALAASFDLAVAIAVLLAPLLFLDAMHLPAAKRDIPIRVVLPPLPPGGAGGFPGAGEREKAAGPRRFTRPTAIPIDPPEATTIVPDPTSGAAPAGRGGGPAGGGAAGPGGNSGNGTGGDGSGAGCCGGPGGTRVGDGPAGPEIWEWHPGLVRPVLIPSSRILPAYPDLARKARVEGTVVLEIVIGPDGTVGAVEVLESPDRRWGFHLAALEAVRRWRYQPALLGGRPIAVHASVTVEFSLGR